MLAGVAGITADANSLVNYARNAAQRYLLAYDDDIPVEQLAQRLCDLKQGYTQYGGESYSCKIFRQGRVRFCSCVLDRRWESTCRVDTVVTRRTGCRPYQFDGRALPFRGARLFLALCGYLKLTIPSHACSLGPGLRPFGVSLLYAGHDPHHRFQLYHSDPSGNYSGWKATCIGSNNGTATSLLKQDYKDGMGIREAMGLAVKVLSKTMDATTLDSEKRE